MPQNAAVLAPGDTVGILGGGQLGRMLAMSCAKLGLHAHIYAPEEDSPAFEVAKAFTCAAYEDAAALAGFAKKVSCVTYEFENVPQSSTEALQAHAPVFPPPSALGIAQDRAREKKFISVLGLPLAKFCLVDSAQDIDGAIEKTGLPAILKTRQFGYDGKGQVKITSAEQALRAFEDLRGVPCIMEAFVALRQELSVIAARGRDGSVALYDVTENVHRDHILHTSTVPAAVTPLLAEAAGDAARTLITALGYVGVLGVEFFVDSQGELVINEMAPRVHNSGHWTLDACACSQFENHIRAIAGWPLGNAGRHSDAVMTNLIGADVDAFAKSLKNNDNLWLYGKGEARAGRKMGHVTRLCRKQ